MTGIGELNSVQAPLVKALAQAGWMHVPGKELNRTFEEPFVESDLVEALVRLNPTIAEDPERADEILPRLRALTLTVRDDGLVETNRAFMSWLRGEQTYQFVGTTGFEPIRLIDFASPSNNVFVVSEEVTFGPPGNRVRFDVVLWVNGFPLVVGELKTPVDGKVSWVNGALDLCNEYQPGHPEFFAANVAVFATEGKQFRYGAIGASPDWWMPWGRDDDEGLAPVIVAATDLCAPETVLDLLRDFTLFEAPEDNEATGLVKIVARYTQYEAVQRLCKRALDPTRKRALVYHTMGSGKTLAMVFTAAKLLRDPAMTNPTIILIADRVQLVNQTWEQFRTADMPRLQTPATAQELRDLLAKDARGLIFSTVHKFSRSGVLNTRDNIVVMVDEAHRTQEGAMGQDLREALPNATFFGFTGSPVSTLDRNTFDTFGDDDDEDRTLHTYGVDESIADGMTVPIHVAPRLREFALDQEGLDEAFEDLKNAEGLSDEDAERLARQVTRASTFYLAPEHVARTCADIVEHFYSTVDPLGMKAQVVAYNREACVAYYDELARLLDEEHPGDEAAVVMSVSTAKGEDPAWQRFALTDTQEEALLKRFRTYGDPLKFLIVTSKLNIGFNAPIEGVMYLDRPMKEHALFQMVTRVNRPWRNPESGQPKRYGLIVDYVNLGDAFAKAMRPANPDQHKSEIDIDGLLDVFESELAVAMTRFAGLDYTNVTTQTLMDAQLRVPKDDRPAFSSQYLALHGIWESIAPNSRLDPHRAAYKFLSQIYASITPSGVRDQLLWQRLGAKTIALVHDHIGHVTITPAETVVIADTDTLRRLEEEGVDTGVVDAEGKSAEEILDTIYKRLKRRMVGPNGKHAQYRSLAERLDKLRERVIDAAEASIDLLRELFRVATDLKAVEDAEDAEGSAGLDKLIDPRVGALTQIFNEFAPENTPEMVGDVVREIDEIVQEVRFDGWAQRADGDRIVRRSIRQVLGKYQMHNVPGLFDRAYEYIAAHY